MKLYQGDCLEVLRGLEDASVDAVVTDPPAGISFMGKSWDHHKGGRAQWVAWMTEVAAECLRVLKPGGHALVWAIPRTSHWTATAWEDAGFEVRDRVSHCFGSGFPKSADVSKALDKMAGEERAIVGPKADPRYQSPASTTPGSPMGRLAPRVNAAKNYAKAGMITAPATEAARQWSGYGTALKPAVEDWWLLRKPLDGTVAQNVLKHGCGGLNIDGCRVDGPGWTKHDGPNGAGFKTDKFMGVAGRGEPTLANGFRQSTLGRFPSNLIHDGSDELVALFPDSKGQQGDVRGTEKSRTGGEGTACYGEFGRIATPKRCDSGSAARFFKSCPDTDPEDTEARRLVYFAKASKRDRDEGNHHPTVKNTALMRYLCRLVTPPHGVILDPFMGSGSTGKAAVLEGFRFVGIEREPEYFEIARARIEAAQRQQRLDLESAA